MKVEFTFPQLAISLRGNICWITFLLTAPAAAHELARLRAVPVEVEVGQSANVAIAFNPRPNINACGTQVNWGDGATEFVKAEGSNPSGTLQHVYRQSGNITVTVEGKTKFQGLFSTFACTGATLATSLRVVPEGTFSRRASAEQERQAAIQREQAETRAALQRAEAATIAAQADAQRQRELAAQVNQRAQMERAQAAQMARAAANRTAPAVAATGMPISQDGPKDTAAKAKPDAPKVKSAMDL